MATPWSGGGALPSPAFSKIDYATLHAPSQTVTSIRNGGLDDFNGFCDLGVGSIGLRLGIPRTTIDPLLRKIGRFD